LNSNAIVLYLGVAFVVLSLFRLFGNQIDSKLILCYSLSAVCIVVYDYWSFLHESINIDLTKKRNIIDRFFINLLMNKHTGEWITMSAVYCIILLPFLPLVQHLSGEQLSEWSDFATLFAIGCTIMLIALKELKSARTKTEQ
jgi:hypothetical protein